MDAVWVAAGVTSSAYTWIHAKHPTSNCLNRVSPNRPQRDRHAPRLWSRLLDGAHPWGSFDATVGRYGVRRYRLIIYPPGTSAADRQLARLWRGWPVSGAALGLLAVMLLGNVAAPPDTVLAYRRGRLREYRRAALSAGRTRPRASQVHVDHPHARKPPTLASNARYTEWQTLVHLLTRADRMLSDWCDLIGRA